MAGAFLLNDLNSLPTAAGATATTTATAKPAETATSSPAA